MNGDWRYGLLLVSALAASSSWHESLAQELPRVREIGFEGNRTTRPEVMLRELLLQDGDPADPALIDRSRQAILDLGLFRAVSVRTEPANDGVRVVFLVEEKWYLLPYPRLSANSDGQNSVGAEIRWNNIWGLNHSLRLIARSRDTQDADRGRELSYRASYQAPFFGASSYGLNLSLAHSLSPVTEPLAYEETVDEAQVLATRRLSVGGSASQGWAIGGGLLWREQQTAGTSAPAPYGTAYALVGQVGYRDVRYRIYSEEGAMFSARYENADRHYGSDYSFTHLKLDWERSIAVGDLPHQTLELGAHAGNANNGPGFRKEYALGGVSGLKGYPHKSFEGDFYYLISAQYLRPLQWDWLRLVVGVEAGNAHPAMDRIDSHPQLSLNLGLRARLTRFVNFDFEAGIAAPLNGGSARFYGDRSDF